MASFIRRSVRADRVSPARAHQALVDLAAAPVVRASHAPLLLRIWELRDNLTAYDAAYLALAEAWQVPLLTTDRAFARVPGTDVDVRLLG